MYANSRLRLKINSVAYHVIIFRTFAEISSVADLQLKCRELCDDLAHDMQQHLIKVCSERVHHYYDHCVQHY
jgi:hypothetical protein